MNERTIFLNFGEKWSPRWNDIDRGKPKNLDKNLSQYHFVHHKSHWIDLGVNPGHHNMLCYPVHWCARQEPKKKDV
jgi:hypothetical protein